MAAYKTIAQNFADAAARLEVATKEARQTQTEALSVVDAVVKENVALKAKVAELEARLAAMPHAVSIGGSIAVPAR